MKQFEGCEGCSVMTKCYKSFSTDLYKSYYKSRMVKCPCKTCLVKVVCDDVCEQYAKVWSFLKQYRDKQYKEVKK